MLFRGFRLRLALPIFNAVVFQERSVSENSQTKSPPSSTQLGAITMGLLGGLVVFCSGCIENTIENTAPVISPAVLTAHRGQLLLTEEPVGALSVLEVRELFTADDDADGQQAPQEVVVVGKIGGMPNPWTDTEPDFPFKKETATLFLVDSATTEKFNVAGHGHEEKVDCPFCARAAAENIDAIAVVNFVDETGQVVPIPAQPLLELPELATIVVQGKAHLVGGKMLVIDAASVYVRP